MDNPMLQDNPFIVRRSPSGNNARASVMNSELLKAAENTRRKIRASFGLANEDTQPAKGKAKAKAEVEVN